MVAKGKVEFIVLARSLDDAMDLCDEDPRDFIGLSMLEPGECELEFETNEITEIGNRYQTFPGIPESTAVRRQKSEE